ncbi:MAG: septum site-determining protein MinC [Legionellales bacterium]|nr:septum site-determining protein MinC [Legionellales bacterium]
MTDNLLKSQAFKLKGRLYTLTVMHVLDGDLALCEKQLIDVISKAPRLFDNTPLVLDCSSIREESFDLAHFCQLLREHSLVPIAIQGGSPLLATIAQCQGLALLNTSLHQNKPKKHKTEGEAITQAPPLLETIRTKLLTTPVRSGQQVVSKGGDLVITSAVSHGAELLADGNIHVYGALRGRALAGIAGDKQARIFCQSLEAELLSIAGFYRLSDAIEPMAGPCQIFLQDDHIQIEPL